ncbi:MFS transporter [Streptomyces griseoluteus]|uniref:MFS transporter n=1 Tax=Streptomyces griseoluteus TaxID=29306 RepID=UPI0036F62591
MGGARQNAGLLTITLVGAVVSSLGAPLIPAIAASTSVSLASAQWTLTITVLVAVVATPLMGGLGDGRHRRPAVLTALALVAAGSVIAAVGTTSFPALLLGRAFQGVGLGLAPVTIAVAGDVFSGERRTRTVAMLSIVNAAGVGLGYPLTGALAQLVGISGAYWFGAAAALIALAAAWAVVPSTPSRPHKPIDLRGALLFALSITALLVAASEGEGWGWTSRRTMTLAALALAIGACWVWLESRARHPLVDLRQLRLPPVLTAHATVLLGGVGMYLLLSLSTRLVQAPVSSGGLGRTVTVAGLVMVPQSIGSFAAPWFTRRASAFLPRRLRLPAAGLVMMLAMGLFMLWSHSIPGLVAAMLLAGIGIGMLFSTVPSLIVDSVDSDQRGSSLGFNQIFRYVGYSIGSVLTSIILTAHTPVGSPYPTSSGYGVAALAGLAVWGVVAITSAATGSRRSTPGYEGQDSA